MVSIILLCRGQWRLTKRCLDAVRKNTSPGSYELLAFDNDSPDQTFKRLSAWSQSWPELKAIKNGRNIPFAEAVNRGMRRGRGEHLLWLNSDAVVGPGWLEGLLASLRSNPCAAAAGPITDHMAPPEQIEAQAVSGQDRDAAFLGGFCFLLKRSALEAAGFLDERFIWGWEDMDYCLRLRQAGFRLILCFGVFVRHDGGRTMRRMPLPQRSKTDLSNRRLMLEKWLYEEPFGTDLRELFRRTGAPWDNYRPRFSIIVPAIPGAKDLLKTLASVRRFSNGENYELLLVEGGARAKRSKRDWPQFRSVSLSGETSLVKLLNRGLRWAQGDFFIILLPGALAAKGWLSPGKSPMISRHEYESVGALDTRLSNSCWDLDYSLRLEMAGFEPRQIAPLSQGAQSRPSLADRRAFQEKWPAELIRGSQISPPEVSLLVLDASRQRALSDCEIIELPKGKIFGERANRAMAAARGRVFIFLSSGVRLKNGWLKRILHQAKRHPGAAMIGAARDGRGQGRVLRAGCVLIRPPLRDAIGGMDQRLSEEHAIADYCLRSWAAGHEVLSVGGILVSLPRRLPESGLKESIRVMARKWAFHPSLR